MDDTPRREQSEEEKKILAQQAQEKKDKEDQKERIEKNEKIRCPCCHKNMYFDQYMSNKQVGCLLCSNCGILFIDQAKLKTIKKNIAEAKQMRSGGLIKQVPANSPLGILQQNAQRLRR